MEALVVLIVILLVSALAYRHGASSLPRIQSQEEAMANAGFLLDSQTLSVLPEGPMQPVTSPSALGSNSW
ncbi:MAG TPA: hypothetical protein VD767_11340, partial [Thermomicrobiales bacterium]|nr:hypothetical protein [Thermomicrobiales bacterium]